MIPYIAVFLFSSILLYLSDKTKKKQKKILVYLAIISLCLLAGFRATDIGTDTREYLTPIFNHALSSDKFSDYLNSSFITSSFATNYVKDYEFLFIIIVYVFTKLTSSIIVVQFVLHLLVLCPIYIALKHRKDVPLWLGFLVYDLMFFNPSLNMIRQSIAVSIVFLSIQLWIENKKKVTIFLITIAFFFHSSALLAVVILIIYEYIRKNYIEIEKTNSSGLKTKIKILILFLVGVVGISFSSVILSLLSAFGFNQYSAYITGSLSFMPNQIIARLPGLILLYLAYSKQRKVYNETSFLMVIAIYDVILSQFTSVSTYGGRLSFYFSIFNVISYSLALRFVKNKSIWKILIVGYLIFYWLFYFAYLGMHDTIPYSPL